MDKVNNDDAIWAILKAYVLLKKYDGIPDLVPAPYRIGLAGKAREILRLWGNMNWEGDQ